MSDERAPDMTSSSVLSKEMPKTDELDKLIPGMWSSHPKALKKQRNWLFFIGLIPILVLLATGLIAVSDFKFLMAMVLHPGMLARAVALVLSFFVGVVGTVALINLIGRANVGNKDDVTGRFEISYTTMVLCSLMWLLPFGASFLPSIRGRGVLIFLLNLLCFAPLGIILVLVLFGHGTASRGVAVIKRRKFWLVLSAFFASLSAYSLLADVHGMLRRLDVLKYLPILKAATLKLIIVGLLFSLAMISFLVWELYKKVIPAENEPENHVDTGTDAKGAPERKSWFRRLFDFLFNPKDEETQPVKADPPKWIGKMRNDFGKKFPNVSIGDVEPLVAIDTVGVSDDDPELELLMGGLKPTKDQSAFFARLKKSYCDRVSGRKAENIDGSKAQHCLSPDIILQGDVGSGRTESLMAAALYGAVARGQNVLFITNYHSQSELAVRKINNRLKALLLENYVQCFLLEETPWLLDKTQRGLPCIYVGTPAALESYVFDAPSRVVDNVSVRQRDFLQGMGLLLFDDMTDLDVVVRSHLFFIVDKLRLLYASEEIVPQCVFVTGRLHRLGEDQLRKRLFDGQEDDFNSENKMLLRNRSSIKGWKLTICTDFVATPESVCKEIVKWCIRSGLNVLLYRKGVGHNVCLNYKEQIKRDLLSRKEEMPSQEILDSLSDRLIVISRLDGSDEELSRVQCRQVDVNAVLYFPELVGECGLAIRLNLGEGDPVFIRILECKEIAEQTMPSNIPLLPGNTAVSLRVCHLRSVIRFIRPYLPIKAIVWNNFGVDASAARVGQIQTQGAETWVFDKWKDDEDAFIVQENVSRMAVRVDVSVLPEMEGFDVIRTGGESGCRLALGRVKNDDSVGTTTHHLRWIKDKNRTNSEINGLRTDLTHANVLTASYNGETYTVDDFVLSDQLDQDGNARPSCRILAKTWNGDGTDFELPMKTFSWEVEPVCAPSASLKNRFVEFSLPLQNNRYRKMSVAIPGFSNYIAIPQNFRDSEFTFDYSARYSGFVLCPAEIGQNFWGAYTQTTLIGKWSTTKGCGFSPVATHLISAAFKRVLPDLTFFASCPVFFVGERPDAVGMAILWVIEPINSGETAYPVLRDIFAGAVTHDKTGVLYMVLQIVKRMIEPLRNLKRKDAFEAYLRILSGMAFDIREYTLDDLNKDLDDTFKLVCELEGSVNGPDPRRRILRPVSPPSMRTTWMNRPHPVAEIQNLGNGSWNAESVLKFDKEMPFDENKGANVCEWNFEGHKYELHVGFASDKDNEEYVQSFMNWKSRSVGGDNIDGRVYAEYGVNDPHREYIKELMGKLKELFEESIAPVHGNERRFAEFLLHFVQSGMQYEKDPRNKNSDWPRFPTETLAKGGGDCEDSSILYMELLRFAGIDNALFSVPKHACVGVDVPMQRTRDGGEAVIYRWADKNYVYAETAMKKGTQRALGSDSKNDDGSSVVSESTIRHVVPTPMEVDMKCVRILNVYASCSSSSITILIKDSLKKDDKIAVLCYARCARFVFDEPVRCENVLIGGMILPVEEPNVARTCTIQFDGSKTSVLRNWWLDVFVCDPNTGTTLGHFVGGEYFSA